MQLKYYMLPTNRSYVYVEETHNSLFQQKHQRKVKLLQDENSTINYHKSLLSSGQTTQTNPEENLLQA